MTAGAGLSVLFVCLGNICRSPTAEAVMRHQLERTGWDSLVEIDSAGLAGWHVGKTPDARSIRRAAARGYAMQSLRARQVVAEDLQRFDLIVAMDADNLRGLEQLAEAERAAGKPVRARFMRLLDVLPELAGSDVPDPYYGDESGFDEVLDLVEPATEALLRKLLQERGVSGCGC